MARVNHPLLIISCKILLRAEQSPQKLAIFRRLANLTRTGSHLLLTASEPDQWFPTRHNVDSVLSAQGRLLQEIQEAGGELDGVYYVPRSMFTQDRNRLGALGDILSRYATDSRNARLITSSRSFAKAAGRLGIETNHLADSAEGIEDLEQTLRTLDKPLVSG